VQPLDRLVEADAATWIDRELVSGAPMPIRDAGFGHDLRDAHVSSMRCVSAEHDPHPAMSPRFR